MVRFFFFFFFVFVFVNGDFPLIRGDITLIM